MSVVDKLNYLQETKSQIKNAIIQKGVSVTDTDSFRSYANKIAQIESGGSSAVEDWQPEPDWWDIEMILENDTEEDMQKAIFLLTDELDDGATINTIKGFKKYKLSDGQVFNQTLSTELDLTNLFDKSQDKVCNKGYKTRYIMGYYDEENVTLSNIVIPDNSIFVIFSGVRFTSSIFKDKKMLQSVKFINNSKIVGNSAENLFNNCYSLKKIEGLDMSNIIKINAMFQNCCSLQKIAGLNTSNTTNMNNAFSNCFSLKQILEIDTSKVDDATGMFQNCYSLQEIPSMDTTNLTNMNYMFFSCYSLQKICGINMSLVDKANSAFGSTRKLIHLKEISQIKISISFSNSSFLNHSSLLRILNALVDLTGQTTQTLTLGTTNLAKLTDEEKAIATEKNWTLA